MYLAKSLIVVKGGLGDAEMESEFINKKTKHKNILNLFDIFINRIKK